MLVKSNNNSNKFLKGYSQILYLLENIRERIVACVHPLRTVPSRRTYIQGVYLCHLTKCVSASGNKQLVDCIQMYENILNMKRKNKCPVSANQIG